LARRTSHRKTARRGGARGWLCATESGGVCGQTQRNPTTTDGGVGGSGRREKIKHRDKSKPVPVKRWRGG